MNVTRKVCLIAVAVLLLASLASCGGSGSGVIIIVERGDLVITNDFGSFFSIDFVEIDGPDFFAFSTFLTPGDSEVLFDIRAGFYTVTLFWTDSSSDTFFDVEVFGGGTTEVIGFN